jgi:hypothetical protein
MVGPGPPAIPASLLLLAGAFDADETLNESDDEDDVTDGENGVASAMHVDAGPAATLTAWAEVQVRSSPLPLAYIHTQACLHTQRGRYVCECT